MDKEFIAEMNRRIDEKNNMSHQQKFEEVLRRMKFNMNYDPAKPTRYTTLEEEKKRKFKEYLEEQNRLIEKGDIDRNTKSLVAEYRHIKIKDIINENHIQWLYEAGKIVDNISNIASAIVDSIAERYNSKNYTVYGIMKKIKFVQNVSSLGDKSCSTINVDCTVYECSTQKQVDELRNNNDLNPAFIRERRAIEIPIAKLGKNWSRMEVLKNVTHELTHFFQIRNNTKITNDKDYDNFNKQYDKITSQAIGSNHHHFRKFSHINQYFTRSEISAEMNSLHIELFKKGVSKMNCMAVYKLTEFYKEYSEVLEEFQNICELPVEIWKEFVKLSQDNQFYKNARLQNPRNANDFKNQWVGFINRMIEYTNKSINRTIYTTIEELASRSNQKNN